MKGSYRHGDSLKFSLRLKDSIGCLHIKKVLQPTGCSTGYFIFLISGNFSFIRDAGSGHCYGYPHRGEDGHCGFHPHGVDHGFLLHAADAHARHNLQVSAA